MPNHRHYKSSGTQWRIYSGGRAREAAASDLCLDTVEAQVTYTAMMTIALMEGQL